MILAFFGSKFDYFTMWILSNFQKKSSVCQIMVKNSNLFSIYLVLYSSIFWWAARLFTPSLLILEQATGHLLLRRSIQSFLLNWWVTIMSVGLCGLTVSVYVIVKVRVNAGSFEEWIIVSLAMTKPLFPLIFSCLTLRNSLKDFSLLSWPTRNHC